MVRRWVLSKDGQTVGPVEEGVLRLWAHQGQIQPGTLLCKEGDSRWIAFEHSVFAEAPRAEMGPLRALAIIGLVALLFIAFVAVVMSWLSSAR